MALADGPEGAPGPLPNKGRNKREKTDSRQTGFQASELESENHIQAQAFALNPRWTLPRPPSGSERPEWAKSNVRCFVVHIGISNQLSRPTPLGQDSTQMSIQISMRIFSEGHAGIFILVFFGALVGQGPLGALAAYRVAPGVPLKGALGPCRGPSMTLARERGREIYIEIHVGIAHRLHRNVDRKLFQRHHGTLPWFCSLEVWGSKLFHF